MSGTYHVSIESVFCAAHALKHYKGSTEPTHGHNFKTIITLTGSKLDEAGILVDFLDLKQWVEEECGRLNYTFLNEHVEEFMPAGGNLSPSAENIARVLYQRLNNRVPAPLKVASVQVYESPGCSATYSE